MRGHLAQLFCGARGEWHDLHAWFDDRWRSLVGCVDNEMHIHATCAERGKSGAPQSLPWPRGRKQFDTGLGEGQVVAHRSGQRGRGDFAVPELHEDSGEPCHGGCRFEVTHQCLDRAHCTARSVIALTQGAVQSFDFNWVAKRRASSMRFDIADAAGIDSGIGDGAGDDIGLGSGARHRVAAGATTGIHGAAADDSEDSVSVSAGIPQRAKQDSANALAGKETIRALAEG